MATNILRLLHSALILRIFLSIVRDEACSHYLVLAEILLTLFRSLLEKRITSKRTKVQILGSMVLGYLLFPNKMRCMSWLFFIKTVEIHQTLKAVRGSFSLFSNQEPFKYLAFIFDYFRFTLNEFMFLGLISLIYRFACDETNEPIPETHTLIYQLVVTASTIGNYKLSLGYGDFTPKSRMQMIFYTYTIPILCASFVVYINNIVDIYTKTFIEGEETEQENLDKTKSI